MVYIQRAILPNASAERMVLSCMKNPQNKSVIYDSEGILQKIKIAAQVKEKLVAENIERDSAINEKGKYARLNKLA